MKKVRLGG